MKSRSSRIFAPGNYQPICFELLLKKGIDLKQRNKKKWSGEHTIAEVAFPCGPMMAMFLPLGMGRMGPSFFSNTKVCCVANRLNACKI